MRPRTASPRRCGSPRASAARRSRCTPRRRRATSSSRFARARNVTRDPARPAAPAAPGRAGCASASRERLLQPRRAVRGHDRRAEDEPARGHLIAASCAATSARPARVRLGDARGRGRDRDLASGVERFLPLANLSLIFLMAVLLVAIRFGLWPSIFASRAELPRLQLLLHRARLHLHWSRARRIVLTLVFFLVVAVDRRQPRGAPQGPGRGDAPIARRTANLYDFSRKIAGAAALDDVLWAAVHHVASTLAVPARSCCCRARAGGSRSRRAIRPRTSSAPTDLGRGAMGLGAWRAGRLGLGHAARRPTGCSCRCETGRGTVGLLGVAFEDAAARS